MMVLPFLTLYTTQALGFTVVQAGMIAGAFGAGSLCGSWLGGWLTDRIGSYKVIVIGLIGGGLGLLSLLFFTTYHSLLIAVFCVSTIGDMLRPGVFSAVALYSGVKNQTRSISLIRMAINLGISIGPALGGLVAGTIGYHFLFVFDGITCLLAAGFFIAYLPAKERKDANSKQEPKNVKNVYTDYQFLLFLLVNMLNLVAFFQILSTIPLFLENIMGLSEIQIGLFFTLNGLIIFIFEMPIIFATEHKKSKLFWATLGAGMIGLGHFALNIDTFWLIPFLLYSILIGFGEILNFPFSNTIALKRGKERGVGKYMGLYTMMFSTCFIIAPILGTTILDKFGFTYLWWFIGTLNMLSVIGFIWIKRLGIEDEDDHSSTNTVPVNVLD
jgi:predicted MFS family arabinose efflux permease